MLYRSVLNTTLISSMSTCPLVGRVSICYLFVRFDLPLLSGMGVWQYVAIFFSLPKNKKNKKKIKNLFSALCRNAPCVVPLCSVLERTMALVHFHVVAHSPDYSGMFIVIPTLISSRTCDFGQDEAVRFLSCRWASSLCRQTRGLLAPRLQREGAITTSLFFPLPI